MRLAAPLPPGSTVGILGGGQLGRMLALAAGQLGLRCHILAPEDGSPAFQVAAAHTVAAYTDRAALEAFSAAVDVVTYEFENVPGETAAFLAGRVPLAPGAQALSTAQDRVDEKTFIAGLGLPVAPFAAIASEQDLAAAVQRIGMLVLVKARDFARQGRVLDFKLVILVEHLGQFFGQPILGDGLLGLRHLFGSLRSLADMIMVL